MKDDFSPLTVHYSGLGPLHKNLQTIHNMRNRVLCRSVYVNPSSGHVQLRTNPNTYTEIYKLKPDFSNLLTLIRKDPVLSAVLTTMPLAIPPTGTQGDPELHLALQDLADIICFEAADAFTSQYYPAVAGMRIPEKLVTQVMCLRGDTLVETEIGAINISDIVNRKLQLKVKTVLPTGEIDYRPIIQWYKNDRLDRQLIKLTLQHGKTNKGAPGRAILTEDHLVLSNIGWIPVSKLSPGIMVATGQVAPNTIMQEVIDGTLLGDAHIAHCNRFSFSQTHIEYAELKKEVLSGLGAITHLKSGKVNNHKTCLVVNFPILIWSKQQRKRWYPAGQKEVPKNLNLTDRMLAVWYMDDGSYLRKRKISFLHTQGFTETDVIFLCDQLNKIGLQCSPMKHGVNKQGLSKFGIRFTVPGTKALHQRIGIFIPEILRYKLNEQETLPFNKNLWIAEKPNTGFDEAVISEPAKWARCINHTNIVYCIDVEDTHNFVTHGGVVHNCALQREMDREGKRVGIPPIVFTDLPKDRQYALTSRRRYWFCKYGVGPRLWKKGTWNLWRIANEDIPEYFFSRFTDDWGRHSGQGAIPNYNYLAGWYYGV